jgi:hypothetical protein
MLFATVSRAEPLGGAAVGLPVGTAAFPTNVAPPVSSTPSTATPAMVAPAAPATVAPVPAMVTPIAPVQTTLQECPEAPSMIDLGAAAISEMLRDGSGVLGLLRVFDSGSDTDVIDDLASKEERRIVFMRRLSEMRDAEGEREFGEKLSLYMRKRAFVQGLEAHQQLSQSPFEPAALKSRR